MIAIDYVLLGVVAVSAIVGLFRGLVREAMSLGVWVLAIWGAWRYGPAVAGFLPMQLADPVLQLWAARGVLLVGVLIFGGLATSLLAYLLGAAGLSGTDRLLGMLFGMARGAILAALVVIGLQFTGFEQAPWWAESRFIPLAAPIAERLRDAASDGLDLLDEAETAS
jgi:membrane protein required for colicin V production